MSAKTDLLKLNHISMRRMHVFALCAHIQVIGSLALAFLQPWQVSVCDFDWYDIFACAWLCFHLWPATEPITSDNTETCVTFPAEFITCHSTPVMLSSIQHRLGHHRRPCWPALLWTKHGPFWRMSLPNPTNALFGDIDDPCLSAAQVRQEERND